MVNIKCKVKFNAKPVIAGVRDGSFKSLEHAAAAIRLTAQRSIKQGKKPSSPGSPPRTRGQRRLRNAIKYAVDSVTRSALIGPDAAVAGDVGKAHEFGGKFRDEHFAKRPFMGPALNQNLRKLPAMWSNSIKG